jgi:hypothetical protein
LRCGREFEFKIRKAINKRLVSFGESLERIVRSLPASIGVLNLTGHLNIFEELLEVLGSRGVRDVGLKMLSGFPVSNHVVESVIVFDVVCPLGLYVHLRKPFVSMARVELRRAQNY